MKTEYQRGRQRRGRRGGRTPGSTPQEPSNQGIFQKILALLGFGKKSQAPTSNSQRPRTNGTASPARAQSQFQPRKPEMVEVVTPRIYVGNLAYEASESDLFELFNGVGSVQNAEVVTNKHTQRSKGFAFVQMTSVEEAKRAVEMLHDKEYMGRRLVVSGAKAPPGSN